MTVSLIVNIDVPDLNTGIAFYETGLGFAVRRRLFGGTVAEMEGSAGRIYLISQPARSNPMPGSTMERDYGRHWTPVHLDIVVDDIEATRDRAVAAGAQGEGPIADHAFGRLAPMRDPFGHGFCLIHLSAAGYDAVADA